jgi:hypothetical protein
MPGRSELALRASFVRISTRDAVRLRRGVRHASITLRSGWLSDLVCTMRSTNLEPKRARSVWLHTCRVVAKCTSHLAALACLSALVMACSHDRPPPPARSVDASARAPREAQVDTPRELETTPYRAKLGLHGAKLYLPRWFHANGEKYDLIVHFHGMARLQEANVERAHLNAAIVSINLGVGTKAYGKAFRDGSAWDQLLAETESAIEESGRAPGARVDRIALSAWSAGFVAVAKILAEPSNAARVDAVLLADGFFTSFTDVKKRTINVASLTRFADLASAAAQDDKLFAITHTAIPTTNYPSVTETVDKLLEMTAHEKSPSDAVGPREMHEHYAVDHGSFHVHGYAGKRARDHIDQIHAMGETLYPYLRARWEKQDAKRAADGQAAP